MKERKCSRCAWFGGDALCHYEPERLAVLPNYWCRHWSETTGWDVFEAKPGEIYSQTTLLTKQLDNMKGLLRLAAELFEKDIRNLDERFALGKGDPVDGTDYGVRERWLEEYRTKC